jgi:hypothetical protein
MVEPFQIHHNALIEAHPHAKEDIRLVHTVLITTQDLAGMSPMSKGNGAAWKTVDRQSRGRAETARLFTGMLYLCADIPLEMKESVTGRHQGAKARNQVNSASGGDAGGHPQLTELFKQSKANLTRYKEYESTLSDPYSEFRCSSENPDGVRRQQRRSQQL